MSDPSDPNSPSDPKSQGKRRKKTAPTVSPSPSSDNIENDEVSSESSPELSEPEEQNEDSDNNDSEPPPKKKSRTKSTKRAADQSKEAATDVASESDEPASENEAEITASEDSEIASSDDSVSLETLLEGSETKEQEPVEPNEDDLDLVDRYGPPSGTRTSQVVREHLRGLIEAILFVSTTPLSINDLIKAAAAQKNEVKEILEELRQFYQTRGFRLDEVAGGWVFRTNPAYAPFVRDMTDQKPVKLTRAQIETLAIVAYKQPITRPEIDDVRGTDSGPMLKLLLERDLVRMLGKKEEAGRPILYGTTPFFLEFFGLRSLRDLPTLREFTELTDESKKTYERKIGEAPEPGLEFLLGTQPTPEQTNTSDPNTTAEATAPQSSEGNEESSTDSTEAAPEAHGDDPPNADAQTAQTEEPNAPTEPQEEPVDEPADAPVDGPVDEPLTDADEGTQSVEGNDEAEPHETVENVETEHSEIAAASEPDGEIVEPIEATPSEIPSESPDDWAPDEQVDVANESIPTSVESSRESSSESQSDLPIEPVSGAATDHEDESETESEANSETELESESETKSESENKPESETESGSETEGDTEAETTQHEEETEPSVAPADESPLVNEESDSEKAEQETSDSTVDQPEEELDVLEVVVEHASFETVLAEMAAELDPLGKNKGEDNKG